MSTRSACEWNLFASEQLLRNWQDQRLSNKDDLDSSVTGKVERECYAEWTTVDFIFVLQCVIDAGLTLK
jgi:hypothetical protein